MTDKRIKRILSTADDAHESEMEELLLAFQQMWPQFNWDDVILTEQNRKKKQKAKK